MRTGRSLTHLPMEPPPQGGQGPRAPVLQGPLQVVQVLLDGAPHLGVVARQGEWSGVEWSGEEWSGVEWSGVEYTCEDYPGPGVVVDDIFLPEPQFGGSHIVPGVQAEEGWEEGAGGWLCMKYFAESINIPWN